MKKFVYPAVLFYDETEQQYTIAMFDLQLYAEGKTVEEAVATAQAYLDKYLEMAFSYDVEIPEPSEFESMIDKYPKNMVVLVESKLNDKNRAI
jgi:predicted RNase H-like HicB family nuclease